MADTREHCVHVVELQVLDASGKPDRWEVWQAENTRQEARDYVRAASPHVKFRIRKYVPERKDAGNG